LSEISTNTKQIVIHRFYINLISISKSTKKKTSAKEDRRVTTDSSTYRNLRKLSLLQ